MRALLPAWAAVVETREDFGEDELFPAEREAISRAVQKRRSEFSTVRACARRALGELGVPAAAILPGVRGAPGWPAGVVGSMTHCQGYRGAVVALSRDGVSLGIDAEPHEALPDGVLDMVALGEERGQLTELGAARPAVHWDRLLFCMKEAVYKTWFPLTGQWLDFEQAHIRIDPDAGQFRAALLVPGPIVHGVSVSEFTGRFAVADGLALSAIAIAA